MVHFTFTLKHPEAKKEPGESQRLRRATRKEEIHPTEQLALQKIVTGVRLRRRANHRLRGMSQMSHSMRPGWAKNWTRPKSRNPMMNRKSYGSAPPTD
jgi:hypothetical protein